jgi:hypothetical protein
VRAVIVAVACMCACGDVRDADAHEASSFVVDVVSFTPGADSGVGADKLPQVVQGPPVGCGESPAPVCGNTNDVVSLGKGGAIVVELGAAIADGEGADFVVFENAFFVGPEPDGGVADWPIFAEAGEVSVSADGETWATWSCAPDAEHPNGCAGYAPVPQRASDADCTAASLACGGDAFDLADLADAPDAPRFVRIVDESTTPAGGQNAGFDLDAIAVLARSDP